MTIFSALKNKGAEAKIVADFTTFQNLFRCETVALCFSVAFADTAIQAITLTVVCKLDQAPEIDLTMEIQFCNVSRSFEKVFAAVVVRIGEEIQKLLFFQGLCNCQLIN